MSVYAEVLDYVRGRAGLAFPPSRVANADAAIDAAMTNLGLIHAGDYVDRLRGNHAAFEELIADLTVGETYFLRDAEQFAMLRTRILPDLIERRGAKHTIRAWSAGCASGEEAYTLAILFRESGLDAHIFATDISTRALAKARDAVYGAWSLRGTSSPFRQRWFTEFDNRYILNDEIRDLVQFDVLNLAEDAYPARLDLILCRNVLIYFDAETIREVGRRLLRALAPEGCLLLGASDPLLEGMEDIDRIATDAGCVYRKGGRASSPAPPIFVPEVVVVEPTEQKSRAGSPASEISPIERLRILADAGRIDEAVELAIELTDRFPLSAEAHLLYALILIDAGQYDAAEPALRRALYLDWSLSDAHAALGALQQRRGDVVAAERSFRNAMEERT